jgi:hypothetical protein
MGLIGNLRGGAGTPGQAGPQWFTEPDSPTLADDATGVDGDLWLNLTSGDLYKKANGTWA